MASVASLITATAPPPPLSVVAGTAAIAVVVAWPWFRLLRLLNVVGVIAHEFGHAAAAVLTGGRVLHIELTGAHEGVTHHRTRRGFPAITTSLAGYCFPPLLGFGAAALLAERQAAWVLTCGVLLCVLVLFVARGVATFVTVILIGGALAVLVLDAGPRWVVAVAYLVAWMLVATGLESVLGLLTARVRGRADDRDDAASLAHQTGIPAVLWLLGWLALAGWCTWGAVTRLWP